MFPGAKIFTSVCLFTCTILTQETIRIIQENPQRMEEIATYEWCIGTPKTLFLVRRTFWLIDHKQSTRNERTDTPSSHSKLLWSNAENE